VGRGGTTLSDGRNRGPEGRVGIAGTADVPGAFGSSILNRMLGGTMRPGGGVGLAAGAAAATGGAAGARSATGAAAGAAATGAGGSSTTGAGAGTPAVAASGAEAGAFATAAGSTGSGTTTAGGSGSWLTGSSTAGAAATGAGAGAGADVGGTGAAEGAAGLAVFTRRGGASVEAAGFGGSAFFPLAGFFSPGFGAGPSANMSPPGSVMPRSRARRSTNWRATTSSMVLDALFSSMPWARFNNASTSWLLVLRSSATL
jgi:hypothetical protein